MLEVLHRRQRVALPQRKVIALDIMLSVVVMIFTPNHYAAVQVLDLVFCVTYDFVAVRVEDGEADRLDFRTISIAPSAVSGMGECADDQNTKNDHCGFNLFAHS